jgi:hypothetical protein
MASEHAKATGREIADYLRTGGKKGIVRPHRRNVARKEEMEYSKDISNLSIEGRISMAKELKDNNSHEAQILKRALMRSAAEENELEDIAGALSGQIKDHHGEVLDFSESGVGGQQIGEFLRVYLNSDHDHEAAEFIEQDVNNIGKKSRRFDYTNHKGHTPHDIAADEEDRASKQAAQIAKLDEQDIMRLPPQNFTTTFFDKDGDNGVRRFSTKSAANVKSIEKLTPGALAWINRAQGRMATDFIPGTIKGDVVEVANAQDAQRIREMWNEGGQAREVVKVFYAKRFGLKNPDEAAKGIKGIKIRVGSEGVIEGGFNDADPSFSINSLKGKGDAAPKSPAGGTRTSGPALRDDSPISGPDDDDNVIQSFE